MLRLAAPFLASLAAGGMAAAQDVVTYPFDGSFEDATFAVETAITGRGLVIDFTSHVGEMLNRTGADVGSTVTVFDAADAFLFCSAVVSRAAMEADWKNIAYCPYSVFVADREGAVAIGYRTYPESSMDAVETLLDDIAREAAGQ